MVATQRPGKGQKVLVMPGDGIGPEVIKKGQEVVLAVAPDLELEHSDLGADRYKRDGTIMPSDLMRRMQEGEFAAIYFGAVGMPGVPIAVPKGILLDTRQRQGLDLYVNERHVRLMDLRDCPLKAVRRLDQVDQVVIRENTEGPYNDVGGHFAPGTPGQVSVGTIITTRFGVERILRYAFERARARRKKLCLVDKSNAMPFAHSLYRDVLKEMQPKYPDVEVTTLYFDIAALEIAYQPWKFDVIVGDNLVGDVISDLTAGLFGGMGVAPSANINPETGVGLFEPVHGSWPQKAGKDEANPIGAALTGAEMLDFMGRRREAARIRKAVLACRKYNLVTRDLVGGTLGTEDAGDAILEMLKPKKRKFV